jgi:DNA-binding response OmpR family regulator
VLLVEDEDDIRDLWVTAFAEEGWVVESAGGGGEAMVKARDFTPDVIVTDLMMPGTDGIELVARLRREQAIRDVPIVLVTALTQGLPSSHETALARRFRLAAVIPKPLAPSALVKRVTTVVAATRQPSDPGSP